MTPTELQERLIILEARIRGQTMVIASLIALLSPLRKEDFQAGIRRFMAMTEKEIAGPLPASEELMGRALLYEFAKILDYSNNGLFQDGD